MKNNKKSKKNNTQNNSQNVVCYQIKQPMPQNYVVNSQEKGFDIKDQEMFNECYNEINGYQRNEDYYFDSYGHFAIHEEMLKDQAQFNNIWVRTRSYQNAILKNSHLFENKIVLDLGSGTGILSMFAAKAGAKHVYGIEFANIAQYSKQIIADNQLSDKITIINSKVENVQLPVEKVDIIISEWMGKQQNIKNLLRKGYFLLYESMLDSVIYARNKWLAPNGLMFPDKANIYIACIEDEKYKQQKFGFWNDVYGFNMKAIQKWALMEPLVDVCQSNIINTDFSKILGLDIQTVKVEDLNFSSSFTLNAKKNDKIHAVICWFDVKFTHGNFPITLSTSPFFQQTHWKQSIFYLQDTFAIEQGDQIQGSIAVTKNQKHQRELCIKLSFHVKNQDAVYYYRLT